MVEFGARQTEGTRVPHDQEGTSARAFRTRPLPKRIHNDEFLGPRILNHLLLDLPLEGGDQPVFR